MSLQTFTFTASERHASEAFGAYHDLYANGTDVMLTGEAFHARVQAYRFARMLVFDRHLHGLLHSRGPARVRRDGFDHVTLHLLLAGSLTGGAPGQESRVAPGEIILFDTTLPQWSRANQAHVVTVSLAREGIEAAVPALRSFHGAVLPVAAAGLLADLIASLARRAGAMTPLAAEPAARAVADFLALALGTGMTPRDGTPSMEQLVPIRRERAEAFIEAHLADPALDAERIATGVGMSRSVLYRCFVADGGVANFIRARRLERMRAALRRKTETRSVSALAYACGFTSESHCNRAFRSAFGQPPGHFRAEVQRARLAPAPGAAPHPILAAWHCELY